MQDAWLRADYRSLFTLTKAILRGSRVSDIDRSSIVGLHSAAAARLPRFVRSQAARWLAAEKGSSDWLWLGKIWHAFNLGNYAEVEKLWRNNGAGEPFRAWCLPKLLRAETLLGADPLCSDDEIFALWEKVPDDFTVEALWCIHNNRNDLFSWMLHSNQGRGVLLIFLTELLTRYIPEDEKERRSGLVLGNLSLHEDVQGIGEISLVHRDLTLLRIIAEFCSKRGIKCLPVYKALFLQHLRHAQLGRSSHAFKEMWRST